MPRGRKRPPQDSVDSILLAISRRDNIDPDTLSHYFDRLDEEWTDGARDKVLHLLRTNDAAACIEKFVAQYPKQSQVLSVAADLYAWNTQFDRELALLGALAELARGRRPVLLGRPVLSAG